MRFVIFPVHLSKLLRLPRKSDARSYEVLHLSRKNISANLKIWCSKMQPLSGNQRPDPLTAPMKMSLVLRVPRNLHLCRSSSNFPRLPSFLEMLHNPHVLLTFWEGAPSLAPATRKHIWTSKRGANMWCFVHFEFQMCFATTACTFSTSQLPKVVRIATSKSGPNLVCFVHFDFEMRFAPQRRALFRHLNFQTWSEPEVFLVFSLASALRATTACNFSSLIWPDGPAPATLASQRPKPTLNRWWITKTKSQNNRSNH